MLVVFAEPNGADSMVEWVFYIFFQCSTKVSSRLAIPTCVCSDNSKVPGSAEVGFAVRLSFLFVDPQSTYFTLL